MGAIVSHFYDDEQISRHFWKNRLLKGKWNVAVTLSSVVIARVAMLRFESVMRFSRSTLQAVTAAGCFMATCNTSTPVSK